MTVLDNVMLGLKGQGIVADRKSAREKLTGLAATYGLLVNPEAPVHTFRGESSRRRSQRPFCTGMVSLLILFAYRRAHSPGNGELFRGLETAAG